MFSDWQIMYSDPEQSWIQMLLYTWKILTESKSQCLQLGTEQ